MNPRDFDDILKDKLKNLDSLHHIQSDWERMERAIDEDSVKDQVFDEQVKRKLEQISIPAFVPTNWDNLYELISRRIQRKKAVFASKAFELAIVALLFLTSINMGVWKVDRTPVMYALEEFSQPINILQEERDIAQASELQESNKIESTTKSIIEDSERNDTQEVIVVNNALSEFQEKHKNQVVNVQRTVDKLKIDNPSFALFTSQLQSSDDIVVSAEASILSNSAELQDHNLIAVENAVKLLPLQTEISTNFPIIQSVSLAQKPKWFVAASFNLNTNFIKSGFKESFVRTRTAEGVEPLESPVNSTNYSIQAELGHKKNRLALSTGFEYQQIEYSPSIELTTGSLSSNLLETNVQSIKYDFFSIPLNLSYDLLSANGWTFGINTGVSVNALARSEQTIDQKIIKGSRTIEVAQEDIDRTVLNYNFQEGIFDEPTVSTDRVWNSLFYRAKIGLGLQKNMGKNTLIFTQANYNFQLPSFQQETSNFEIDDNIRSVSVGFGVRQFFG